MTSPLPRPLLLGLALLLGALIPARGALAGESDFLPDNVGWSGYSSLDALARAAGSSIVHREQLSWSELPADSALILAYPRRALPLAQLLAFLKRGGRVLVADDFGRSEAFLNQLGIRRVTHAAVQAGRLHDGNHNLPVANVWHGGDPLVAGLSEVVTNHPAYLLSRRPSLLGFARGRQQVLVRVPVGEGQLVVLSDPSVLINTMMQFPGNRRLARNLVAWLRPEGGGAIQLLSREFKLAGEVRRGPPRTDSVSGVLGEFNKFLGELNDYALIKRGLRALALVGGGLGVLGLLLLVPMQRRDMDGHWITPQGGSPASLEDEVVRFGKQGGLGGNAAYPAAVLREELEEGLGLLLDAPGPLSTIHPRWVVQKVRAQAGEHAGQLCHKLLADLRRVPHPTHAAEGPFLSGVSPKDLRQIYDQAQQLFLMLDSRPGLPAVTASRNNGSD